MDSGSRSGGTEQLHLCTGWRDWAKPGWKRMGRSRSLFFCGTMCQFVCLVLGVFRKCFIFPILTINILSNLIFALQHFDWWKSLISLENIFIWILIQPSWLSYNFLQYTLLYNWYFLLSIRMLDQLQINIQYVCPTRIPILFHQLSYFIRHPSQYVCVCSRRFIYLYIYYVFYKYICIEIYICCFYML